MEEIRLTSWYGKYPIIYEVSYMSGGAGFLPSTVWVKIYGLGGKGQNKWYITTENAAKQQQQQQQHQQQQQQQKQLQQQQLQQQQQEGQRQLQEVLESLPVLGMDRGQVMVMTYCNPLTGNVASCLSKNPSLDPLWSWCLSNTTRLELYQMIYNI